VAGIPYFFKQVGGRTPKAGGRLLDGCTWDEMPVPEPEKEAALAVAH
jgi:protein gp37